MLALQNIHKSFGDNQVLKGIDIAAPSGTVTVIIGPSGSGKTTLLRAINFLEPADKGRITLDALSFDIETCSRQDIRNIRRETAMVFQHYNLFNNMTALGNIMAGLVTVQKIPIKEARETAEYFLAKVGLREKANAYPHQLSGGQQQRIGIARALALNPKVILFDEPTSSLDPELVNEVLEVMQQAAGEAKSTMIVVTHEIAFARDVASMVVFMDQGLVVEQGKPNEVLGRPAHARTRQFLARYTQLAGEYDI